jgi:hypothetical protein
MNGVGARSLLLGLVPLVAALFASCEGEAVTLDVGAPVEPPARPVAELAVWGPAGAIRIVRIGERGAGRRRLLGIGDVRRFFLDRVAWSPGGRRLAFTGESGLGYRQINIWTVDADSGGLRRVTRTGDALWPVWAPDGRSIVYARLEDLRSDRGGSLDYSSSLCSALRTGRQQRRLLLNGRSRSVVEPSLVSEDAWCRPERARFGWSTRRALSREARSADAALPTASTLLWGRLP